MNLEFDNEETKKLFKSYATKHPGLSGVIKVLRKEYGNLKVIDIVDDIYATQFIIGTDKGVIYLNLDLLKKKIKINDTNKKHIEVYDDLFKNKPVPDSYEYENEDKLVIKKKTYNLDKEEKKNLYYVIQNKKNGNEYAIILFSKSMYCEQEIIDYILNNCDITNIRTFFLSLSNKLNLSLFDLKMTDSKGCIIYMQDGVLSKYVEYIEKEDSYSKVYLKNDDFYIKKTVKEKYDDESIELIKKIGGMDGKEKK